MTTENKEQYSSIVTQVIDGLNPNIRMDTIENLKSSSDSYNLWSIEQLCALIFCVLWSFFTLTEFSFGIIDKNEALLSEAFHSFFHSFGSFLTFACLTLTKRKRNGDSFPYGTGKLNVLTGFINGLNTMFSAFFVLVKQSHFLLDTEHHLDGEDIKKPSFKYEKYLVCIKVLISIVMLIFLRQYLIYVTSKRSYYIDIKDFYAKILKKWNSKYDNIHSFCLILFHQAFEKSTIFILDLLDIKTGSYMRNTLVTITVSLITVWVSLPLCINTFINLVQGLSAPHSELLETLKKEIKEKYINEVEISDSRFWQVDMSYIVGSMKIKVNNRKLDYAEEIKKYLDPYVKEITIEMELYSD